MSTPEAESAERSFMLAAERRMPGVAGYRDPESRRETDRKLRDHVAGQLGHLAAKVGEIRKVADDEGDADMADDLSRLEERFRRTAEAISASAPPEQEFLGRAAMRSEELTHVHSNDAAMLEDLDLLGKDMGTLKYETIGTLTLREVEGTLASIELKVSNRKHLLGGASA